MSYRCRMRRHVNEDSIRRRQRGIAPFDAQNTTLVPDRNFHFATSTRIRTIRCTEHHSGAQSQLPFVDVNEDSHPSMRRTQLWCPIAISILRRQRGFAPIDAQNTTLLSDRICHGIYSQDTLAPGWPFLGRLSGPFIGRACAREARALCRPCLAGLPGT